MFGSSTDVIARLDQATQYSRDAHDRAERPRRTGSPASAGDDRYGVCNDDSEQAARAAPRRKSTAFPAWRNRFAAALLADASHSIVSPEPIAGQAATAKGATRERDDGPGRGIAAQPRVNRRERPASLSERQLAAAVCAAAPRGPYSLLRGLAVRALLV